MRRILVGYGISTCVVYVVPLLASCHGAFIVGPYDEWGEKGSRSESALRSGNHSAWRSEAKSRYNIGKIENQCLFSDVSTSEVVHFEKGVLL